MKTDFEPFEIGTVFNPLNATIASNKPRFSSVVIKFPSRLNAMAIDPSKITSNRNLVYTPGEVVFSVKIYKAIKVEIVPGKDKLEIDTRAKRKPLIEHSYQLMKKAIGFDESLRISVDNSGEIRHAGLGSSSGLIAGVAAAVNELYGNLIPAAKLVRYLSQNHGEEINNDDKHLNPVQCIGGSAASGLFEGGLIVLAGESTVIGTMKIDPNYKAIIGIPDDYEEYDSKILMDKEIENFDKFLETGKRYGPKIAYDLLHLGLPGMVNSNLMPMGDLIYDYRFNMGSIANCSYCYPPLVAIAERLKYLKEKDMTEVLAISSVGPAFFAITPNVEVVVKAFEKEHLKTFATDIENGKYALVNKQI
ncbi:MAG: hypothetical protein A3A96_00790 [Candidatus Zambryskibacteria bacterium RIFCSPLOWO2_01_FULL_39_39]|uniref:GHMP kinase N-terminal domain-containing protein n=1 Tax=Candidatus Zambryskibacteria bacterium RIFCSPLOWO2_01_FULL_39_39 TaxID=1802758 RepID=A0A1G2TY88_9BACT|nr:MAG: hypothetical protein A3B88_00595 [Candidatus Zambryskibacteria bacterium RIFCSPHIGHO2_02_FULL_39_19]OHB02204.1 MAG: hypothetical protein A3A96_00790 [Candidatus Zambryskibacteria bacterium RIFCSPLOWO2_01_FULL_39_39]